MNSEIISSRYAKALLSFTTETGSGNKVYSQAISIVQMLQEVPQLRDFILIHDIPLNKKRDLLSTAIGESLAEDLGKFMALVAARRRMELLDEILLSYIHKYRQANNIKVGNLVTAAPNEHLKQSLETIFGSRTGSEVQLQSVVDPDLLGGFIFELDGYRLDASVRTRLEKIRQTLVDDRGRIV